jgi:anti-sigma B factor antagonist
MFILEKDEGTKKILAIEGKLDAVTSPNLEQVFFNLSPIIKEVILDFSKLTYISSLGLRAILQGFKQMKGRGGKLRVINIPDSVHSVFEMSGFIGAFVRDEKFVAIEKEDAIDHTTYSLSGVLDSAGAYSLKLKCQEKDRRSGCIILDCQALQSITEEGCEELISIRYTCSEQGANLLLKNISESVSDEIKSFKKTEILDWLKK